MITYLNYLQGRDKMISEFKFFHGITKKGIRRLRATWGPDLIERRVDVEGELIRVMSQEIARGIDKEIINTIVRRINGGSNHGIDYLNHWLRVGENRA
jgi:hypothetical protein